MNIKKLYYCIIIISTVIFFSLFLSVPVDHTQNENIKHTTEIEHKSNLKNMTFMPDAINDISDSIESVIVENIPSGIYYQNGKLTINVIEYPLGPALEEISIVSGISIHTESLSGNTLLTATLNAIPLDDGLRDILANQDSFFLYSANKNSDIQNLSAIWVFRKGQGIDNTPVIESSNYAESSIDTLMTNENPNIRATALESYIGENPEGAISTVLSAMNDPDADVRSRTLFKAINTDMALTLDTLESLLRNDPAAMVKIFALEALAEQLVLTDINYLRDLAEQYINDNEDSVRESALDIIAHIQSTVAPDLDDKEDDQQTRDSINETLKIDS